MTKSKPKFYVVWRGSRPGVYRTWGECQAAVEGYSNAKFKSFPTMAAAQQAYQDGPGDHWGKPKSPKAALSEEDLAAFGSPEPQSLCVDAACNGQPGDMEYQGVWLHDQSVAFAQGPYPLATNNIGEFLAIVHGLAMLQEKGLDWPIYSDSRTAIGWVQKRRANSKVQRDGKTSQRGQSLGRSCGKVAGIP